jgi:hypothetical protein
VLAIQPIIQEKAGKKSGWFFGRLQRSKAKNAVFGGLPAGPADTTFCVDKPMTVDILASRPENGAVGVVKDQAGDRPLFDCSRAWI